MEFGQKLATAILAILQFATSVQCAPIAPTETTSWSDLTTEMTSGMTTETSEQSTATFSEALTKATPVEDKPRADLGTAIDLASNANRDARKAFVKLCRANKTSGSRCRDLLVQWGNSDILSLPASLTLDTAVCQNTQVILQAVYNVTKVAQEIVADLLGESGYKSLLTLLRCLTDELSCIIEDTSLASTPGPAVSTIAGDQDLVMTFMATLVNRTATFSDIMRTLNACQ